MIVFLDFEASSLAKKSFPIEVAWVFENGTSQSFLIKPAPDWIDWSAKAEQLHQISQQQLEAEGTPVEAVAAEMMRVLSGHELFASAPSWDGKWLSVLLRAAGLARHSLRLQKSDEAFAEAARRHFAEPYPHEAVSDLVADVIRATEPEAPIHRALPDAELELERWKIVSSRAASMAAAR